MKLFKNLSRTSKIMMASICGLCLVFLVLGLIVLTVVYPFDKPLPFMAGVAAGCVHSVVKVFLMEKSFSRTLDMEKERAKVMATLLSIARYGVTAVVFVLVILLPQVFGLIGAVLGVISLHLSSYVTNMILKKLDGV